MALVARNAHSSWVKPFTIKVAAPAPAESSVAVKLVVTAPNGSFSSSTTDTYDATLTATCNYADGSSEPCPVPNGTVSWQALGGDAGGNFMYNSTPYTGCTSSVGGSTSTSDCQIDWSTYGDQWVSATYVSSPSDNFESQFNINADVAVHIQAPVDLAYTDVYETYGNTGPQGIGDCSMAAAADWLETTFGTTPDSQDVENAYWSAEDQYNAGADAGLTPEQLFSYWEANPIGGYTLTGTTSLNVSDTNDIETYLSQNYVLLASETLPANYPIGDGQGGGHFWIVVGYSDFGPMIVSWGQEFQISWVDFNSWTTGIWALGATQS